MVRKITVWLSLDLCFSEINNNKITVDLYLAQKITGDQNKYDTCSVARGLLLPFRPGDTLCKCALLVAEMEPSPYPVPLGLLHLLRFTLGGENQTSTKGGDSSLTDGLFGVPHGHKNIVKEGLYLLEEEGGDTDGQLTENQNLGEKSIWRTHLYQFCSLRNTAS